MPDLSPSPTATDTTLAEVDASRPQRRPECFSFDSVSWCTHRADIRYVRWGSYELVRRIFVTVRDTHWQEVPPSEWSCQATRHGDRFDLLLTARHDTAGIQLDWRGVFSVDLATREISFRLMGTVPAELTVNRVGLVVLHPADGLIGGSAAVAGPSGEHTVDLTKQVRPQHIIDGLPTGMTPPFTNLTTTFRDGRSLRFDFSGELFEIEDQRSFGDASYKSYCPPLADGFPRTFASGTKIEQAVICHVPQDFDTSARNTASSATDTLALPRRHEHATVPQLGAQRPANADWSSATGLTHIRADIAATSGEAALRAVRDSSDPGQLLEVALALTAQDDLPEEFVAGLCDDSRIFRVLLKETGQKVISREVADRACRALKRHGCQVPVATAVDGYFVEVNRGVPVDIAGDGLAVAVCPTVHSGDVLTVAENVGALPDIIETARALFPGHEVTVSPLTLHLGPPPDPDAYTTAALPWFIGSLERVAHLDLPSLTLGADVLPDPSEQPDLARAWTSVLTLLNDARNAPTRATTALPGELLHAIAWETHPGEENLLIANLADHDRVVTLDGARTPTEARLIWSPSDSVTSHDGQSPEFTVPAYGVVHTRVRAT